jgi:glycosyltransferase involved in cell wall biosynthesis
MPKVTIIIPVYNVEKYIYACLDSVVNQTLTDIQIICVDDGSPDSCPQILDEYAAKDNRFKIIHQQNAGLASARNAAYPFIKGEYTLFVDSDDTIEPDLCEKTVIVADAEQADTTYFFFDRGENQRKNKSIYRWNCKMKKLIGKQYLTENDYSILLKYPMVWLKLWRSQFLLDNDIRCPANYSAEDNFMNWKALVQNPKITLLPEVMYHNRINPLSIMHEPSQKHLMGYPAMYDLLKEMLLKLDRYHDQWKRLFLHKKLETFRVVYCNLPTNRRVEYLRLVKDRFGLDEQEYLLQKNKIKRCVKVFYFALLGSRFAAIENAVYIALRQTEIVFRKFRNKWKQIS